MIDFVAELAEPSPQGWHKCALALDELHDAWINSKSIIERCFNAEMLGKAIDRCHQAINTWPTIAKKAVPREPLEHWRRSTGPADQGHDDLLDLCLKVKHESATYDYYTTYICNDPALLFPGGRQQCHLARGFTGSARSIKSERWLKVGEPGQGDLIGWLSVELPPYGLVAVKLEVEVKMPSGRLSPGQRRRRDELERAGALYLSARSVPSAVGQIVAVRNALQRSGMRAAHAAVEEWRSAHPW